MNLSPLPPGNVLHVHADQLARVQASLIADDGKLSHRQTYRLRRPCWRCSNLTDGVGAACHDCPRRLT